MVFIFSHSSLTLLGQTTVDGSDFFYPSLTLITSVFLLIIIRVWGDITTVATEIRDIGLDLNLFTYGFLTDTGIKALKGDPYWLSSGTNGFIDISADHKGTVLFCIALTNLVLTLVNLKLKKSLHSSSSTSFSNLFSTVVMIFVGLISAFTYLLLSTMWQ